MTYWIDLTDLMTWRGVYTGIPRTIYRVAKYYAENENAKFFYFNERKNSFIEVEFASVIPNVIEDEGDDNPPTRRQEIRESMIVGVKNIYAKTFPDDLKRKITPRAKPLIRSAYINSQKVKGSLRRDPNKKHTYRQNAYFENGDVVLIIGAGWGKPSIIPALVEVKKEKAIKIVHFIHDLIPVFAPQYFGPGFGRSFTEYAFEALIASDILLTNSIASKNDTNRFMQEVGIPPKPIEVIRLGDELDNVIKAKKPRSVNSDFILCVGTVEVRKNHRLLYQVYKAAKAKGILLPKLIIVGRPGWLVSDLIFEINNDPEVVGDIQFVPAGDKELTWLYQNALFSIYPSHYEGWGLPIAESLVNGKICIASSASSMPEIAGDLIEYFEPYDAAACLSLVKKYLDKDYRLKRESIIAKEYKAQSWVETAKATKQAIIKNLKS